MNKLLKNILIGIFAFVLMFTFLPLVTASDIYANGTETEAYNFSTVKNCFCKWWNMQN